MSKQHVLIVDDEPKYLTLLSETFSDIEVSTAKNGHDAIALLADKSPDIIVLDVVMPDMDGYEVCKAIRSRPSTRTTPIVFYSGMTTLEGKIKAYDLGGNDFICKNCPSEEVRAKVLRMLTSEKEHQAILKELEAGNNLIHNMQKETSALHLLAQFSQACQFCFDYEILATVLFNCLSKLNLRGVVYFHDDDSVYSSSGSCYRLEEELLRNASSFGRIHSFSENRAILNWKTCSLLVKDVNDELDAMAHFMGALRSGLRSLEMKKKILKKVVSLESNYLELQGKLSGDVGMSGNLKEQLFDSGFISRFDLDAKDEADLDRILTSNGKSDLSSFINNAESSAAEISHLLKEINTPPEELLELFVKRDSIYIESEDVDDVLF